MTKTVEKFFGVREIKEADLMTKACEPCTCEPFAL